MRFLKTHLLKIILLLLIVFIAVNCESDKHEPEEEPIQKVLDIKAYRFSTDSIFKTNSTLKNQITKKFSTKNSNKASRLTSQEYGFSIDTSRVQLLASSTYESFTFVVEREEYNPEILENYVLTIYNDGTYNQLLITYPVIELEGEITYDIDNATGQYINDTSLLSRVECGPNEVPIASWQQTCIDINCGLSGNHRPGQACNDGVYRARTECVGAWVESCQGVGGSGPGGNTGDNPPNGSGSTGGTSGTGEDDTAVVPFEPDYVTDIMDCLNGAGAGTATIGEANNNSTLEAQLNTLGVETQLGIKRYLLRDNTCSPEAQEFTQLAVEAFMEDGDVDFENEIIKDSTFVGTKADCVYELLKSTNNNLFKNVMDDFTNNNSKFRLKFKIGNVPAGADGATNYNSETGLITIILPPAINVMTSLEVAGIILHEGIHAELMRIYHGNNLGSNPLPQNQFDYLVSLYEYFQGTSPANLVANNASHTFMVYYHVMPISNAIRELDNNLYSINHYKAFGWDGLSQIGMITNPPLVTNAQLSNYINLQQIPINDNNLQSCDE